MISWRALESLKKVEKSTYQRPCVTLTRDQGSYFGGQDAVWGGRGVTTIKQLAYYLTRPWAKGPANFHSRFRF